MMLLEHDTLKLLRQSGLKWTKATVVVGTRTFEIVAARDQDTILDQSNSFVNFPFGFLLWEAAVGLARVVDSIGDGLTGLKVLELGAGVGLPGIVARSWGARVLLTDHQPLALDLARMNGALNDLDIDTEQRDWRSWEHGAQYDLIIGSDILYSRDLHDTLHHLLSRCLKPGGFVLLSDPGRQQALDFAAMLERNGWSLSLSTETVTLETSGCGLPAVDVGVYTLRRDL